jgi:hypothetical protein
VRFALAVRTDLLLFIHDSRMSCKSFHPHYVRGDIWHGGTRTKVMTKERNAPPQAVNPGPASWGSTIPSTHHRTIGISRYARALEGRLAQNFYECSYQASHTREAGSQHLPFASPTDCVENDSAIVLRGDGTHLCIQSPPGPPSPRR